MRLFTVVLAMLALSAVSTNALSQSRDEAHKVRLVLKDSMSGRGMSGVIRRERGLPVIVFRRSEFSPELLGMALTILAADATEHTDIKRGKSETIIPAGMALPALEGEWGQQVTTIAVSLQSSDLAVAADVGRGRSLVVDLPSPRPCAKCPKSTERDKP